MAGPGSLWVAYISLGRGPPGTLNSQPSGWSGTHSITRFVHVIPIQGEQPQTGHFFRYFISISPGLFGQSCLVSEADSEPKMSEQWFIKEEAPEEISKERREGGIRKEKASKVDFPGGAVDKNLLASAGDTGSILDLGTKILQGRLKPLDHSCWDCALEPASHNRWSPSISSLCPAARQAPVGRN